MTHKVWGVYNKETQELEIMFVYRSEAEFYKRQLEQSGGEYEVKTLEIKD